jgi:hypothetical protein
MTTVRLRHRSAACRRKRRLHNLLGLTILVGTVVYVTLLLSLQGGKWLPVAYAAGVVSGFVLSRRIG